MAEQKVGADLYADTHGFGYLNEVPIANFLDEQMALPHQPVYTYTFISASLEQVLADASTDTKM